MGFGGAMPSVSPPRCVPQKPRGPPNHFFLAGQRKNRPHKYGAAVAPHAIGVAAPTVEHLDSRSGMNCHGRRAHGPLDIPDISPSHCARSWSSAGIVVQQADRSPPENTSFTSMRPARGIGHACDQHRADAAKLAAEASPENGSGSQTRAWFMGAAPPRRGRGGGEKKPRRAPKKKKKKWGNAKKPRKSGFNRFTGNKRVPCPIEGFLTIASCRLNARRRHLSQGDRGHVAAFTHIDMNAKATDRI